MRPCTLSIRWRVSLTLGLMALLIVVMAAVSAAGMRQAAQLLARAGESHHQMELTSRLSGSINAYLVERINGLMQGREDEGVRAARDGIDAVFTQIGASLSAEISLVSDHAERADERSEVQRIARLHSEVRALFDRARETGRDPGVRELASRLTRTVRERIRPRIDTILADEQAEIDAVEAEMRSLRERLLVLGIALGIVCIVLAVAAAWHINGVIHQPISALIRAVSALSSGDLRKRLPRTRRDELGLLARHFNRMARHLEHHRDKLETLNSELEQRVAERTRSLAQSNTRLQEIDDSRKRFLANVSHELRTPLTAILGETELGLADLAEDAESAQTLRRIHANAAYLRRRVQDLLLLARSEEGELRVVPETSDLAELITDVCRQVRGIADVEQVGIKLELRPETATAMVDRSWIGQCLMGLIDNAVKFSMPGDCVTVTLDKEPDAWRIEILDQGPGFDGVELPRLFERYHQSEGGRTRGGAGLGLAIAHWIIGEHGGAITASNIDQGACVTLRLPKGDAPI